MLTDTELAALPLDDGAEQHTTEKGSEQGGAHSNTGAQTQVHIGDGDEGTGHGTEHDGADSERLVLGAVDLMCGWKGVSE